MASEEMQELGEAAADIQGGGAEFFSAVAQELARLQEALRQHEESVSRLLEAGTQRDASIDASAITRRLEEMIEEEVRSVTRRLGGRLEEVERSVSQRLEARAEEERSSERMGELGEMRSIIQRLEEGLGRVEEKVADLDRQVYQVGEIEGIEDAGGLRRLERRMSKLESAIQRALDVVFPRVNALMSELEARSRPTSYPVMTPSTALASPAPSPSSPSPSPSSSPSSSPSPSPSPSSSFTTASDYFPATNRYESLANFALQRSPNTSSSPSAAPALRQPSIWEIFKEEVKVGNLRVVRELLQNGLDPNYSSDAGQTPLMWACSNGETRIAALLLEWGADVRAESCTRWTALHHAAKGDRSGECVSLLLEAGALVNTRSNLDSTPLHFAALWENEGAARALLSAGASKTSRNNKGRLPVDMTYTETIRQMLLP